jgi:hypothetical protein
MIRIAEMKMVYTNTVKVALRNMLVRDACKINPSDDI